MTGSFSDVYRQKCRSASVFVDHRKTTFTGRFQDTFLYRDYNEITRSGKPEFCVTLRNRAYGLNWRAMPRFMNPIANL